MVSNGPPRPAHPVDRPAAPDGAGHGGGQRLASTAGHGRLASNSTQLNMNKEEGRAPIPAPTAREDADEKARKAVAVDIARLVDLLRDAAHEPF